MFSLGLIVPAVAAGTFTIAMLMPLRDARRGERATVPGFRPLRPLFAGITGQLHGDAVRRQILERIVDRLDARLGACFSWIRTPPSSHDASEHGEDVDRKPSRTPDGGMFADELARLTDGRVDVSTAVDSPSELPGAPVERTGDADDLDKHVLRREANPPLTRLRLRPGIADVSWPSLLARPRSDLSEHERHAVLASLDRNDPSAAVVACAAFAEENAAGRILALKALSAARSDAALGLIVRALREGNDDERVLAIDLLADRGEIARIVEALDDRVDAIAARAALAYVGSGTHAQYERALAPFLSPARLGSIIALLAGAIE